MRLCTPPFGDMELLPCAPLNPRSMLSACSLLSGPPQREPPRVHPPCSQALRNVSHAYTLDHQQEEQLFLDLDKVISQLKTLKTSAEARALSMDVRRMCAAIRASLETHVRR